MGKEEKAGRREEVEGRGGEVMGRRGKGGGWVMSEGLNN